MSTPYTPTPVFPASFVIPDDGDPKTASSVNVGLEALGDRTQFLYLKGGRQYASYSAVRAILAPADGDRVYLPFAGEFTFKTSAVGAEDLPLTIVPTDATPGSWVNSTFYGLINDPSGAPRMSGFKVKPQYITNALLAKDVLGPDPADQQTNSTTFVDVPGMSFTIPNAMAGDVLFARAMFHFDVTTNAVQWRTLVVDPGFGTTVDMDVGADGSYGHEFKYVIASAGPSTLTVKGQFRTTNAATPAFLVKQRTCLSYELVRP